LLVGRAPIPRSYTSPLLLVSATTRGSERRTGAGGEIGGGVLSLGFLLDRSLLSISALRGTKRTLETPIHNLCVFPIG
jgi:hypothetical protein